RLKRSKARGQGHHSRRSVTPGDPARREPACGRSQDHLGGRNVLLDRKFSPLITKDGVTVAKEIELTASVRSLRVIRSERPPSRDLFCNPKERMSLIADWRGREMQVAQSSGGVLA